tara:strand:+ start:482 stop:682 length:201 start_codon:yes stop_codon:yes gene_type:complete
MTLQELQHKYIAQFLEDISFEDAIDNLSLYMIDEYKNHTKEQMLELLEDSGYEDLIDKYLKESGVE